MKTTLYLILLISLLSGAAAFRCHSSHEYNDGNQHARRTNSHMRVCTSYFDLEDRLATYWGSAGDPANVKPIQQLEKGEDCILINQESKSGFPPMHGYFCYCFSSYCNTMISFEEFENNGFALRPKTGTIDA